MASYTINITDEDIRFLKAETKTRDSFEAIRRAIQKVILQRKMGE